MLFPLQTFSIQLFVFDYFTSLLSIVDFTFPSNSRVGTIQCLTITVINDNVYEESLVLTVTLSKFNDESRKNGLRKHRDNGDYQ